MNTTKSGLSLSILNFEGLWQQLHGSRRASVGGWNLSYFIAVIFKVHIKIDFISNWKLEYLFKCDTAVTTFLRDKANNLEWRNEFMWLRRGKRSEASCLSLLSYRYISIWSFSPPSVSLVMVVIPKRINWLLKAKSWELVEFCRSPKYWFAIENSMDSVPFLEAVAPHLLIPGLQWFLLWGPALVWILSHQRKGTVSQHKNKNCSIHFIIFNSFLLLCLVTRSIINILCLYLLFSRIESFIRKLSPTRKSVHLAPTQVVSVHLTQIVQSSWLMLSPT